MPADVDLGRRQRAGRLLLGAVAVALLALGHVVVPSTRAAAAGPDLVLEGRGHGHGRGMSQWGAYGAASSGLGWTGILAFYYPGTARSTSMTGAVRVLVGADTGADVHVQASPGLALRSGSSTAALPTGSAYDAWRLVRSGGSTVLQRQDAGSWRTVAPPVALGATVGFVLPGGPVRLVLPDGRAIGYRGEVRAVQDGSAGLRTVAVLDLQEYLRGVVPAEMSPSWPLEALRAQAVAARTFAARLRALNASTAWDLCDSTSCQVFRGSGRYAADGSLLESYEHPRVDAAIADTAGTVLTWTSGGRTSIALTEFGAANGGTTAAGTLPYQASRSDPYDGAVASSSHAWTATVPASRIESAYRSIGTFRSLVVLSRDGAGEWGGRVLTARLLGSAGSVQVTGDQLRSVLGLRSSWVRTGAGAHPRDLTGDLAADVLAMSPTGRLGVYPGWRRGAPTGLGSRIEISRGWAGARLLTQVGDWDGDGRADLVASGADGRLLLYRGVTGAAAPGFAAPLAIGRGWGSVSDLLGVGDLDGDGAADLLARRSMDQTLWLYPGDGRGGFGSARSIGRGWGGLGLLTAVGDLDADGRPDVVARRVADGALVLFRGGAGGVLRAGVPIGARWGAVRSLSGPGDLGLDGAADLVASDGTGVLRRYAWIGGGLTDAGPLGRGWAGTRLVG